MVVTERSLSVDRVFNSIATSSKTPALRLLIAEVHVGNDVQIVAQCEVLIHGGNAKGRGFARSVRVDLLGLPKDLATRWLPDARNGLDESGLASAVVADKTR